MKTAAIICEYNPFHEGHKYHIARTKTLCGAASVVCIMSGNYVQRGDVAVFDKALRAKAAIACGADLVLELPTVFSMQSAEFFAQKAVDIANATGIVDYLSFGAESSNLDDIIKVARLLSDEPTELSALLKESLIRGMTYAAARAKAIASILGDSFAEIIKSPNNILGVEYCKALLKSQSSITPLAVTRKGSAHDSNHPSESFASATYLRELFSTKNKDQALQYMPAVCRELFDNAKIHSLQNMEQAILAELIKMSASRLAEISDVSEGMENRIKQAVQKSKTLEELADAVKTKRYTHSRIRRVLLSAYMGITSADRSLSVPYIKILDHTEKGRKLISQMKKSATLPVVRNTSQINKLKNPEIKALWERERIFDTLFELF